MTIGRVSDAQSSALLVARAGRLQASIDDLEEQIASGKRFERPEQDGFGAAQVVRSNNTLGGLAQYASTSSFGSTVLGAQDQALGDAEQIMVRAQEIATQQASGLLSPSERAAAREEVHGLLQGLTAIGNQELAGRRLFGGLALDAPPPFTDPDATGYSAATAYVGSTQEFSIQVGGSASERVRISTRGDTVFADGLTSLEALQTALGPGGNVASTLTGLAQGQATIDAQRASVGSREAQLIDRGQQLSGLTVHEQQTLSHVQDADLAAVVAQLTQAQTALQATLAVAAQLAHTSLVSLLQL
jgi:flagellar hook-associated protein 3 FlgL